MLELRETTRLLEAAEQSAAADDLDTADDLLKSVARIQEAELGPQHPDLANTLNNLAIVAEKAGRLDEAESFYRRAVAIASASLPADHPMIAASRENLEAFCRARGVPIETPAETPAEAPAETVTETPAETLAEAETATEPETAVATTLPLPEQTAPEPDAILVGDAVAVETPPEVVAAGTRVDVVAHAAPAAVDADKTAAPRRLLGVVAWVAIGAVFVTAAVLVRQPWSSRETPVNPPPARTAPAEQARPPTVAPERDTGNTPTTPPIASSSSSDVFTLATAELCRKFSTGGKVWQCDPAGDTVAPGALVLYTQVKSTRDGEIVHRWYQGDTLRQSVRLPIQANAIRGYRTYSRLTVDEGSNWRVEVRSAKGEMLHVQRFVVH